MACIVRIYGTSYSKYEKNNSTKVVTLGIDVAIHVKENEWSAFASLHMFIELN